MSPLSTVTFGWSPYAMRVRADMGSPWLPVQRMSTLSRGSSIASFGETMASSGNSTYPSVRAMFMFLRIERPTIATMRPLAIATSAACWTRCMFDANEATMMRPVRNGMSCRNASPTSRSEPVIPGRSAFVESPSRRSMPRLPRSASAPTSVLSPSTGVWSSFQSPVCSTRPASVSITIAIESGIECAMRTNSSVNGPKRMVAPPGSASVSRVDAASPCSSSFDLTSPSVSLVPTTSPTSTSRSRYGSPPT